MKTKALNVKKSTDEVEPFSLDKLKKSLKSCGATKEEVETIIPQILQQVYDGISTKEIHNKAFSILKKYDRVYAAKYNLKHAIFDLGPTGFPFERLISALLRQKGYKTKVGVLLKGKCVTHEIDVLAEKEGNTYAIECKFHSTTNAVSNVKVPLYINSRFLDIQEQWNSNPKKATHLKQGWLVTNTRFTLDAVNYGKCVGLTLLSWDYPKGNGISQNIDAYGLYPITALTSLSKREKEQIIAMDIILVKELVKGSHYLKKIHISPQRIKKVLSEVEKLCGIKISR